MILASGITVGTVSMISQAYGAKCAEGVAHITAHSLILGIGISGVLTVLAQLYPEAIVRLAGMPPGIQEIAEAFIRIFSLVLVPTYVMFITSGTLRASGRIRLSMINSFVGSATNVVGNFVLAFGWGPIPALGYKGIAWATVVGIGLGTVLNLVPVMRGPGSLTTTAFTTPLPRCFGNLVKLGFPSAMQQIAWNVGTLVIYFLLGRLQVGEITALAAMTAGVRIEGIIFLPIFAMNMASAVLTGNRLGSGDETGARSAARVTAGLSLGIVCLPVIAMIIFAPGISSLLSEDTAVVQEMIRYLRINMIGMPFFAIGVSLSGALQGAGDTLATMKIVFAGMWLIRIPLILLAMYGLHTGATGVWWAMTISIVIMCGMFIGRFRGNAWTKASVDQKTKTMFWQACVPAELVCGSTGGWESDSIGSQNQDES
jgi:putative MATE family efflux protein